MDAQRQPMIAAAQIIQRCLTVGSKGETPSAVPRHSLDCPHGCSSPLRSSLYRSHSHRKCCFLIHPQLMQRGTPCLLHKMHSGHRRRPCQCCRLHIYTLQAQQIQGPRCLLWQGTFRTGFVPFCLGSCLVGTAHKLPAQMHLGIRQRYKAHTR